MKANSFGRYFGFTAFGESHGPAIGVVIEDIKPGITFPLNKIQAELDKRRPGQGKFSTSRSEKDKVVVLSGVFEGKTTGMPICLLVYNKDVRSGDYDHIKDIFRPGHADFSYFKKFKIYDYRGGGRASGRETISRVAASALVDDILGNITINMYPVKIGEIEANNYNPETTNDLYWPDPSNYNKLISYLNEIKESGDSIGGIVEVHINNLPTGLGDPVYEKLDANLAKAIVSLGSVKGIEFGNGFQLATLKGSQANDQLSKTGFNSNNAGGILGGISTGEEIVFRFVVKPTPSINIPQKTITHNGEEIEFISGGRHDICIIPRIIPAAKAMIKLVLADAISHQKLIAEEKSSLNDYREALDKIDEDILIALTRRNQISQLIGKYKKENNIQITDPEREKVLFSELEKKAELWNMDKEFIRQLWNIILKESKKQQ